MKRYLLILSFSFLFVTPYAQDLLTTIPLTHLYPKNIQGCALGDSIFLSYLDQGYDDAIFKNTFILPDGSQKAINTPELQNKTLLGAINFPDSVYIYYLQDIQKSIIQAIVFDKKTEKRKIVRFPLRIEKGILGVHIDKDLSIAYLQDTSKTLRLVQIHGRKVIHKKTYPMPISLSSQDLSAVTLIAENDALTTLQAEANTKIYFTSKGLLTILVDKKKRVADSPELKTTIVCIDSSGNYTMKVLPEPSNTTFSTILHKGYLYKIARNDGFLISIYDLNCSLIKSFSINKNTSYKKSIAYIRDGATKRVLNERTVWEAIDNRGTPFLSIHTIDSVTLMLKVGTHSKMMQSAPVPIIGSLGLAVTLVTAAIRVASVTDSGLSLDHYFYLVGNTKSGFAYTNESNTISQKIDLHELYNEKGIDYSCKSYLHTNSYTYGIYQRKWKKKYLTIVKFKN